MKLSGLVFASALFVVGCSGSQPAPSGNKAPDAERAVTCEEFAPHLVDLLVTAQGANAMVSKSDIPMMIAECNKSGDLAKMQKDARCVMKAKTLAEAGPCNIDAFFK